MDGCNYKIRQFQDELVNLTNSFVDIPVEAKLICLELITVKLQKVADEAIMEELKEAENAKSIQPN